MRRERQRKLDMQKRTLLVGAGASADFLMHDMRLNPENCYQPVCVVDDDPAKKGRFFHGMPVAGTVDAIRSYAKQKKLTLFLFVHHPPQKNRKNAFMKNAWKPIAKHF